MRGRRQLLELFEGWDGRSGPIPYEEIRESLRDLELGPFDLDGLARFDGRAYQRVSVHCRLHYQALVLGWRSGQGSPIHDHTGSSCVVRVVRGLATETRFTETSCGRLVPRSSKSYPAGSVLSCRGDGIHQMANLEAPGLDLVTLHVYSPPPARWRYYPVDRTTLAGNDSLIRDRPETLVVDLMPSATTRCLNREVTALESINRSEKVDVAIVGGGFSGSMVAVQLARLAGSTPIRVALFEKGERFAKGVAYGTRSDRHLLNVPAGLMSALPDEPAHFLNWLRARDPSAHPGTFAPRRLYGEYLGDLLQSARTGPTARVELVGEEAVSLESAGNSGPFRVSTRSGDSIEAGRVVLAIGHQTPQGLGGWENPPSSDAYVADPWSPGAFDGLRPDDPVALIGTGLTAVDLVVEARAGGHRGPIYAISRHGLMPFRHPSAPAPPRPHFSVPAPDAAPTARGLVRKLRAEAQTCQADGGDWRSVVDSVRPVAQSLWGSLADRERRRFLRHVASRWDVHRHRLAPAIDDEIQAARDSGQLEVIAARVRGFRDEWGLVALSLRRRGCAEAETLHVRRVINCTGPGRDIRAGSSPFLRSILDGGLGRPGPLNLGLDVAGSGALIRGDGVPHDRVFAIGPLLKESLWETTAVRELRSQAQELARRLVESHAQSV